MIPLNYGVQLVTRAEWGARAPRSVTPLSASIVTSHWEGPHMGSFPHSSCAAKVRGIQNFHMDGRGWSDIAYNAIACPHRFVFEGRGRGVRSAANGTTAGNNGAFAICYLGGEGDPFTEDGKAAMKAGGDWLTRVGSARNCHRDWKSTACPGDTICSWTKAGQPISGTTPPPQPGKKDDKMYAMIKGNNDPSGAVYLTDMMVKIHMVDPQMVADFQSALRSTPGTVLHNNLDVVTWGQEDVNQIPEARTEVRDAFTWWDAVGDGPAHGVVNDATADLNQKLDHVIDLLHALTPPVEPEPEPVPPA